MLDNIYVFGLLVYSNEGHTVKLRFTPVDNGDGSGYDTNPEFNQGLNNVCTWITHIAGSMLLPVCVGLDETTNLLIVSQKKGDSSHEERWRWVVERCDCGDVANLSGPSMALPFALLLAKALFIKCKDDLNDSDFVQRLGIMRLEMICASGLLLEDGRIEPVGDLSVKIDELLVNGFKRGVRILAVSANHVNHESEPIPRTGQLVGDGVYLFKKDGNMLILVTARDVSECIEKIVELQARAFLYI
jgi:hypothetical protein